MPIRSGTRWRDKCFCVNEANAVIVNDEITNAAVRTTTLDAMIPYKEDGYDNAQTWLVDKCNMKTHNMRMLYILFKITEAILNRMTF